MHSTRLTAQTTGDLGDLFGIFFMPGIVCGTMEETKEWVVVNRTSDYFLEVSVGWEGGAARTWAWREYDF